MEIMLPSVTTAKVPDTWPENALQKDNRDHQETTSQEPTSQETTLPSATTVKNLDTLPENAPRKEENKDNQESKESTESLENKLQENAITARRSVTSQETAQKEETERRTLSATNVTKTDILPEIAKVIFSITFRLSRLNEVNSKPKRTEDMIFFIFHSKQFLFF